MTNSPEFPTDSGSVTAQVSVVPNRPIPGGHPLALEDETPADSSVKDAEKKVKSEKGIYHRVRPGDTLWDVARLHQVSTETVEKANYDFNAAALPLGGTLFVPDGKPMPTATVAAARRRAGSTLQWPLRGRITSPFGNRRDPFTGRQAFHAGIDLAAGSGTPIGAAAAGRVAYVGWEGGYGLTVRINHGNGLVTRYSHNSRNAVTVGQWVEAGQVVAYVGSTGRSSGPHLDFGVYRNGQAEDPLRYLP